MVDEREFLKQYSYKATSNLVLEQERSSRRERKAGTGEVAPLNSDELPGRMGDLAGRRVGESGEPSEDKRKKRKSSRRRSSDEGNRAGLRQALSGDTPRVGLNADALPSDINVVDVADERELNADHGGYVPTTPSSRKAFEALLSFMLSKIGDQPRDLLRSAAGEALAALKDQNSTEVQRKKAVEEMLSVRLSSDEYSTLSAMGRQIMDYGDDAQSKEALVPPTDVAEGVAVLFEEEELEDESAGSSGIDEAIDIREELGKGEIDLLPVAATARESLNEETVGLSPIDTRPAGAVHQGSSLNLREVDEQWLKRQLGNHYNNAEQCKRMVDEVWNILSSDDDDRTCENRLAMILEFDKFDLISALVRNREVIVFGTRLASAKTEDERSEIEQELQKSDTGRDLLQKLRLSESHARGPRSTRSVTPDSNANRPLQVSTDAEGQDCRADSKGGASRKRRKQRFTLRKLDLESLSFQKGGRSMALRDVELPTGSEHTQGKDYEEWHIPAARAVSGAGEKLLISTNTLPEWGRPAFPNMQTFNKMQSIVYPCAFQSDENMLLCAPTGAGKTNVAMLAILRAVQTSLHLENHLDGIKNADFSSFMAVYVAPMKALVTEVVENLGRRLANLGMSVRELTGDVNLSKQEIARTQVIVTTPEKWDVITRKSMEREFTTLVRLLIVDEVHLLHDERGAVLEAIVARTLRGVDSLTSTTRVVALSATLPNYKDVASFLRVNTESGLFYFDSSYRPCALQQCYVGVTAKKALKRFQVMNEKTYEKVKQQLQSANQVIVFVHSRKETHSTCEYLMSRAIDDEATDLFMKPGESFEVIRAEATNVQSKELSSLLEQGLATHHAGMSRKDRQLVEALFEDGHIKVLVSTATLAWGVNLPAHAVIIKGTQVYSPENGRWVELSPMDVMQMMGRAGRPQFDTFGEGFIITSKHDVLYYLSLLNHQLPIESQFISRLVDMLNAEVARGSVSSVDEGSVWLSYTYLYVRMLGNPSLYGIPADELQADPSLERRRAELVHAAASRLHQSGSLLYDVRAGTMLSTELGRIAADYYISHESMSMYSERMKPFTSDVDLFQLFSMSKEFRHMRVRAEEKLELMRLAARVPIPVKESPEESTAKVNVLLQSFISNLSLDGLALKADMVHVTQNAARLSRAMLQVAIRMKCAGLAEKCLSLCKAVSKRQWSSQTPMRQFRDFLSASVIHKIERKDIGFERYYDLTVAELGELLRDPKLGRTLHRFVHSLPRLELEARVRPQSRSTIEIELTLSPDFRFDTKLHGGGENFWIFVEDADSEVLLHAENFFLRRPLASEEHVLNLKVPLSAPQPPQYFVKCVSDKWIVPETTLPISFNRLILPEKFPPHMKLMVGPLLSVSEAFLALEGSTDRFRDGSENEAVRAAQTYFGSLFTHFPPLLTQLFPSLFSSVSNVVVATLPSVDRTLCVELSIASLFCADPSALVLWVVARGECAVDSVRTRLARGIGKVLDVEIACFLSDRSSDVNALRSTRSIVLTTSERWDSFSRKWRQKREGKVISRIGLVVIDGIHMVEENDGRGAALEILTSRMRYIAADMTEHGMNPFRIICVSDPIANAKEIGHWVGAPPSAVFSYHPRDLGNSVNVTALGIASRSASLDASVSALSRQLYSAIRRQRRRSKSSVLVYVPSRKLARSLALELLHAAAQSGDPKQFMPDERTDDGHRDAVTTGALNACLEHGIGYVHDGMKRKENVVIEEFFESGKVQVLFATSDFAWKLTVSRPCLTIIAGTEREAIGGLAVRRLQYSRTDLMKMLCSTGTALDEDVALIITTNSLRDFYELSMEPAPVESQIQETLSDHLNAEIAAGVVESKQDAVDYLTWTFFYRRLSKNPNYYGMHTLSNAGISNHLSELIETALSDLENSKCIAAEGDEDVALGALNLGIIASHYYLRLTTVELFASSLTPRTRLRGLLRILSLASEFSIVPVRVGDEEALKAISGRVLVSPAGDESISFSRTHAKTHLLLQAQLSREKLSGDLASDLEMILPIAVRLLRAMVDVTSSAGWLKPALAAVELTQMLTQGIWETDSPLLQLPHVDDTLVSNLQNVYDVTDIFGFLGMDPSSRTKVLTKLSDDEILELASACQRFPNLEDVEIQSVEQVLGEDSQVSVKVSVRVSRNDEGDDHESHSEGKRKSVPLASAPRYPEPREEGWWVIIGEVKTNSVLTLKHFVLKTELVIRLEFSLPLQTQNQKLHLYLLSDSYVDCDQEEEFELGVVNKGSLV